MCKNSCSQALKPAEQTDYLLIATDSEAKELTAKLKGDAGSIGVALVTAMLMDSQIYQVLKAATLIYESARPGLISYDSTEKVITLIDTVNAKR